MKVIAGEPMHASKRVNIVSSSDLPSDPQAAWMLHGITSNERYVDRMEKTHIVAKLLGLGRAETSCAALIPIRKSAAWRALTQDERLNIFKDQSKHTKIGLQYILTLARRLHHCWDLSEHESFDFITWFEYAPSEETVFNNLLSELRGIEEWQYVEREVDI